MDRVLHQVMKHHIETFLPFSLPKDSSIWVVDDERFEFRIIEKGLIQSKQAYSMEHLTNVEHLLGRLEKIDEGAEAGPAMIMMDINMRGMNGLEALQAVRKMSSNQSKPYIVMMSNTAHPEDVDHCRRLGANMFIVKPDQLGWYAEFFNSLA
ncbi:MAG: response regulator [Bdellovibrionota bacterium]